MYSLSYVKAKSVKEAADFLNKHPEAKLLSGGMTLLPTLKQRLARPTHLVDIANLAELAKIETKAGKLVIGAGVKHHVVATSAVVKKAIPALAGLAGSIGDPQVRNQGTIGGALAHNDPAADYPSAVLGLGATVTTNKRSIAADKFFTGTFATALKPGEIITSVTFPLPKRAAYVKFRQPASRFALVGVFVSEGAGTVRVAVTGAGACVFRAKAMEKRLAENFTPDAIARVKNAPDDLTSDMHASAEYRAHLVGVIAQRAVEAAIAGK